jgi:hypothetical protein
MKVRATRLGYLGHRRRKPGAVFHIEDHLFSKQWMEKFDVVHASLDADDPPKPLKVNGSYTLEKLYEYCKSKGLSGYSGMSKEELVTAINGDELQSSVRDVSTDNVI